MKKTIYLILGTLILFPIKISDVLGINIDSFRQDVLRPDNLPAGTALKSTTAEGKINVILNFSIDLILYTSGGIAVFLLVLGGIRYITSLGNQERMEGAKKTIQYALMGLAAVILAYAVVTNIIDLIFKATV